MYPSCGSLLSRTFQRFRKCYVNEKTPYERSCNFVCDNMFVVLKQTKIILTLQYSVEIISNRETTLELEGETYNESSEHCKFCKRSLLLLNLDL